MRYGADQGDWAHFTLILGLEPHLLPVVSNPNANISPNSSLKRLGQIPSLYSYDNNVIGFSKWTEHHSNAKDIATWSVVPDYGICLQTRAVRALDCDITDPDLALEVYTWLETHLPVALPLRGRENASKFLMPFRLAGKHGKRVLRLSGDNKIEFLADGQQFIAVGTHPSGVRYQWRDGLPREIPELTIEQFEVIWAGLKEAFGASEAREDFSERAPAGGDVNDTETLTFLEKAGVVTGWSTEGAAYVTCPFKSGHSKEGDRTETIYFPKGLRGYESGHFKCLHASCAGYSDDDFLRALGYWSDKFEDLGPLSEAEIVEAQQEKALTNPDFKWESVFEFSKRPKPEYIVRDILPKADLAFIIGESRAGKSFLALDLAFAVARGIDWNGKKVKQGTVVYVCAEGSGDFRNRVLAYVKKHGISDEEFVKIPLHILPATPNLLDIKQARKLSASILPLGPISLHFVDTLAQTTPGANENGGEDMGLAISHCREIGRITNSMSVLVHHTGHTNKDRGRGWSGMPAAADAEIVVSGIEGTREVLVTKLKGGKTGEKWGMNLVTVGVDFYDDGAVMDSCAVEYVAPPEKDPGKGRTLTGIGQDILEVINYAGVEGYTAKGLVAAVRERTGEQNKASNVLRAARGLLEKGLISSDDDGKDSFLALKL